MNNLNKRLPIVTINQALNLKELGFDWLEDNPFCHIWDINDDWDIPEWQLDYYGEAATRWVHAPEVALALKWLRDATNNEEIFVRKNRDGKQYSWYGDGNPSVLNYDTYEEAESAALDNSLGYLLRMKNMVL